MYSKEELQRGLTTQVVGSKMFVFETIDSTNACARTLGDAGTQEGAVVVTNFQTSGRGRLGRIWLAEPDANLLFSVLLRPRISVDVSGQLTLYASVAIARAIEQCVGEPVECKWPNDLLLNGKKFCGILLENSSQQSELSYAVIGAGINVNQQTLSPEIASRATSLCIETGKTFDRKKVFQVVLQELDLLYKSAREGDFSFIEAVTVQQHDHTIAGTALRLNHDAGLVISTSEGIQTIYAGDITLVS
jgi:BirA family biotin operon repressor/biotin-[acetyl-CoA-carboxylase] ligase